MLCPMVRAMLPASANACSVRLRTSPNSPGFRTTAEARRGLSQPLSRACRTSVGVSTDEAFSRQLLADGLARQGAKGRYRRIYVFSNRAWTKASVKQILAEVDKWDAVSRLSR